MIVSMLAAAALMAQAAPAAADPKPTSADPVVCKNEPAPGSRLAKKVCATKSEWERRKQADRDNLEQSQRQRPMSGSGF